MNDNSNLKTQKIIFFVNGYTYKCKPLKEYWTEKGNQFLDAANDYFGKNCDFLFVNGEGPWYSGANYRFKKGKIFATKMLEDHKNKFTKKTSLFFVTHSMGSAYAEGMISILNEEKFNIKNVIHLSSANAKSIHFSKNLESIERIQIGICGDKTLKLFSNPLPYFSKFKIPKIKIYGEILSDIKEFHPEVTVLDQKKWDFHYDTKTFAYIWKYIENLETINKTFSNKNLKQIKIDNITRFVQFNSFCLDNEFYILDKKTCNSKNLIYNKYN